MRRLIASLLFAAGLNCQPTALPAAEITVHFQDLHQSPSTDWVASGIEVPPVDRSLPVVGRSARDAASTLLRRLDTSGEASGFEGILYDNRDRGHSALDPTRFPRLHRLTYGIDLRLQNLDFGLANAIRYPAIVLGNSSTAMTTGPRARSLPRFSMTTPGEPEASERLYRHNHIYVYPEHRDYDEIDRFPANWPYQVISQGSSGSDKPFLHAIAATLAAFPHDTLAVLQDRGLIAPTVQMILRRNLRQVSTAQDYVSGAGHPPVLRGEDLRPARMVSHAASLRPEDVPPRVTLKVIEEDFHDAAGLAGLDEKLFDTQSAVARLWRGFEWRKSMLVVASAEGTPLPVELMFSWHLLQGDPQRVQIDPIDDHGQRARITVNWHDPFVTPTGQADGPSARRTSRVDIGVFASHGRETSAPAILSIAFPAHQERTYVEDGQTGPRLVRVDYDAATRGVYVDPVLFWSAGWTDTATYDETGTLTSWRRVFAEDERGEITVSALAPPGTYALNIRDGRRVLDFLK